jgi:hypothetical protein
MKTFTPEVKTGFNYILLNYDSQYELMYSLARFQEFYENPILKGKYFSREDLQLISPDYYISWAGCNFPSAVIIEMLDLGFIFDRHELVVCDLVRKSGLYVVVGIHSNDRSTLSHELVHVLYCSNKKYAFEVGRIVNSDREEFGKLRKYLLGMGYDDSVIIDEINAYCVGLVKHGGLRSKYSKVLRSLFKVYSKLV